MAELAPDVETPTGDPNDCWIFRGAISTEQASGLQVGIDELVRRFDYGSGPAPYRPTALCRAPGGQGGGNATGIPEGGTHVARYAERLAEPTAQLASATLLTRTMGRRLVKTPLQLTIFTKPGDEPSRGSAAHVDNNGGFIFLMLAGEKTFHLQPTRVRHPFSDTGGFYEHAGKFATGPVTPVHVKAGDLAAIGGHMLHGIENGPGFTQHFRFTYPTDLRLPQQLRILQHHRSQGRLSEQTCEALDAVTAGPAVPTNWDEYQLVQKAFNGAFFDLTAAGILDGPFDNPAAPFFNPREVVNSLELGMRSVEVARQLSGMQPELQRVAVD